MVNNLAKSCIAQKVNKISNKLIKRKTIFGTKTYMSLTDGKTKYNNGVSNLLEDFRMVIVDFSVEVFISTLLHLYNQRCIEQLFILLWCVLVTFIFTNIKNKK